MTLQKNLLGVLLVSYASSALAAGCAMAFGGGARLAFLVFWFGGAAAALGLNVLVFLLAKEAPAERDRDPLDASLEEQLRRWDEDIAEDRESARNERAQG